MLAFANSSLSRYTIAFTVGRKSGVLVQFSAVAYQENAEQILWMDADNFALFSGSLQR